MIDRRRVRHALELLLVGLLYYVAGRGGLLLAGPHPSVTTVWAPTGIAVAACLLYGPAAVFSVWLAAWAVNVAVSGDPVGSALIAFGNAGEGALAARLVVRRCGSAMMLQRARDLIYFACVALPAGAALSATVGVGALWLRHSAAAPSLPQLWTTWGLGDLAGGLLVTPLIVAWMRPTAMGAMVARRLETAAFAACLAAVGWLIFGVRVPVPLARVPAAVLFVPLLVWSAFRLGPRGTALVAVALAGMAVASTVAGTGPFDQAPLASLQVFTSVMGLTCLVMSVLVVEQRMSVVILEAARGMLERRVAEQHRDLSRSEEGLQRQDRVLRTILENVADGVIVTDRAGRLLEVSAEVRRLFGVPPAVALSTWTELHEAIRGRVFRADGVTPCAESELPLARALAGESVAEEEIFLRERRGAGGGRWLTKSARPLRDTAGEWIGAVALIRDVNARHHAEALRLAKEQAEAASEAKSRFLATVSHELRTPLTAIIGYVNLLLHDRVEGPAERQRYLERARDNGKMLLEEINDLLDLAKIEAGRMSTVRVPLVLEPFLQELVGGLEWQARARGLTLEAVCERGLPEVVTDPAKLRRILVNLVGNAIKFTERGGVTVRARAEDGAVRVRVEDTGIGIPPEKLGVIFNAFQQVDEGRARHHEGVGLGLAICRSLTELLGGRLTVESRPGTGSVFTLHLSVDAGAPARAPGASAGREEVHHG